MGFDSILSKLIPILNLALKSGSFIKFIWPFCVWEARNTAVCTGRLVTYNFDLLNKMFLTQCYKLLDPNTRDPTAWQLSCKYITALNAIISLEKSHSVSLVDLRMTPGHRGALLSDVMTLQTMFHWDRLAESKKMYKSFFYPSLNQHWWMFSTFGLEVQ